MKLLTILVSRSLGWIGPPPRSLPMLMRIQIRQQQLKLLLNHLPKIQFCYCGFMKEFWRGKTLETCQTVTQHQLLWHLPFQLTHNKWQGSEKRKVEKHIFFLLFSISTPFRPHSFCSKTLGQDGTLEMLHCIQNSCLNANEKSWPLRTNKWKKNDCHNLFRVIRKLFVMELGCCP